MGLAQDIESKVRLAIAAQEADDFTLASRYLRSAILLIQAHPRIKFEESETEYSQDSLTAMLKEMRRLEVQQKQKNNGSGGFVGIPIRNRIG